MRNLKISQVQRHTNPDRYMCILNWCPRPAVVPSRNCTLPTKPFLSLHAQKQENIVLSTFLTCISTSFLKQLLKTTYSSSNHLRISLVIALNRWYSRIPVGRNTLDTKLGKMCSLAGIEWRVTNHSMRATSVTQMYATGVPEKVIQERTGHRSLEALCVYERTNNQ